MSDEQRPNLIDTKVLHSKRPLSPHLSIYSLQLTSGLSILHRIMGAYLYFGLIILAWTVFALVYSLDILSDIVVFIYGNKAVYVLFKIMLFFWTFALFYHQFNGIRHLFWDIGKGFELKSAYRSGKLVLISSLLITMLCWLFVCAPNFL